MKYIFKQVDDWTPSETTVEFTADSLETILEQFQFFLRGAGYNFEGVLDFVVEEERDFDSINLDLSSYGAAQPVEEFEIDTTVMAHVAADLLRQMENKELEKERCSVCGLSAELMADHTCFDKKCPLQESLPF